MFNTATLVSTESFPKVGGKYVVCTVVDRFSKYGHFIALGHPFTATSVAAAFFENVVRLHGIPCPLLVIGVLCLQVMCGLSSLNSRVSRSISALHFTLRWMDSLRQPIEFWEFIFDAWIEIDPAVGYIGCPMPCFATTHHFKQHCNPHHLRSFMAEHHHPCCHIPVA